MLKFDNEPNFDKKLQLLCVTNLPDPILHNVLDSIHENFKTFYLFLGPERCRANGYHYSELKKELEIVTYNTEAIDQEIFRLFNVGEKYTWKYIKQELKSIYNSHGYKKSPKATDLSNWFELRTVKFTIAGKKENGFEIIKRKD